MQSMTFPTYRGRSCNMMPIIMGDASSIPEDLRQYYPLTQRCGFECGAVVFLTVDESYVAKGHTQRRPGIHVESPNPSISWGGWGGQANSTDGIYMASTDGRTRVWAVEISDDAIGRHGSVLSSKVTGVAPRDLQPNELAWISDRTPHEALPARVDGRRQFFRLVGPKIGVWYEQHSTSNPLVAVPPHVKIIKESKFACSK